MEEQRRKRVKVEDPLTPVRLSPVRVKGHTVTQQGVEIQNDDGSWEAINIHSADYNLVPNAEADRITRQILSESALRWEKMNEVWTGRYWARLYKSDTSADVPSVGDTLSRPAGREQLRRKLPVQIDPHGLRLVLFKRSCKSPELHKVYDATHNEQ